MLDLDFIRQNSKRVKGAIEAKAIDLDLDKFLSLDERRRSLISKVDGLRAKQREFNKKVGSLSGEERSKAIADMKVLSRDLKQEEEDLGRVKEEWLKLYLLVPNIPSDDTPVGASSEDNAEVEKWGEPKKFNFKARNHLELGEDLDLFDLKRGAKTSGFRGYYLKNEAAVMQVALLWHTFKKMSSLGFEPMITPTILKDFALVGSGHFPFARDDIYELANTGKDERGKRLGEPLYLAGTSEPSILAYFADSLLKEEDLPKRVCGFSQCYRNEVGSYGKDTRGLYRIHEFMKVEQVILCRADERESEKHLNEMLAISREILKELELPHRVLQICTGDMGAGKRKMYDIETWMPSRGWGETHSDSDLTDWQSRRLNIKYQTRRGEKKFAFALNNTVIASPRILIAILENYQNKDGSVTVPKALAPLCGFKSITKK